MSEATKQKAGREGEWQLADLAPVLEALRGLRYGSVELIIQDYRLMQIDRREKIRSFRT